LQPAQLERTQPPQLEPLAPPSPEESPELFDVPPIANVEKAFRHFLQPHSGQQGFLSFCERTKTSKRLPQRSQSYSNIGIGPCLSSPRVRRAHGARYPARRECQGDHAAKRGRRFQPGRSMAKAGREAVRYAFTP
jgi:hypothetical protein